jgi:hypothetical protein
VSENNTRERRFDGNPDIESLIRPHLLAMGKRKSAVTLAAIVTEGCTLSRKGREPSRSVTVRDGAQES